MIDLEQKLTDKKEVQEFIRRALEEDIQHGDATTNAIVDETTSANAAWIAKETGIVAGLDVARLVYQEFDTEFEWHCHCEDGDQISAGTTVVEMHGACRAVLSAERIALNIVQRMSGIATMTNRYVELVSDYDVKILDTRKTVPGMRLLDKYAVATGGGTNHRMGLFDMVMIKDNHIAAAGSIADAVLSVRNAEPNLKIEVETTTLEQVDEALAAGADIIMLDNMSMHQMKEAVTLIEGEAETEASGNISLESIEKVAQTGVDYISVGALTHSVKAFDISQQIQKDF
jgi:nicotinate-nucleotide pyrophosphorylase (carboxylating)